MLRRERMFAGSFRGSTATLPGVTSVVVDSVELGGLVAGCGFTSATLGWRSSIAAGFCSSGVDAHPTSIPTTPHIAIHRFIASLLLSLPLQSKLSCAPQLNLFCKWPPCRLANIASTFAEALHHSTVARNAG